MDSYFSKQIHSVQAIAHCDLQFFAKDLFLSLPFVKHLLTNLYNPWGGLGPCSDYPAHLTLCERLTPNTPILASSLTSVATEVPAVPYF